MVRPLHVTVFEKPLEWSKISNMSSQKASFLNASLSQFFWPGMIQLLYVYVFLNDDVTSSLPLLHHVSYL